MPASLDRRTLLRAAAVAPFSGLAVPRRLRDDPTLPEPDLADARLIQRVAGLRPHRPSGIRLEAERIGEKLVVHNYGHGGAGVTLSWGSAEEAAALLGEALPPPAAVAVLGAGAVGLATARVLQERGYTVRVVARDFPPHTTSNVAGAEWLPVAVAAGESAEAKTRFARIVRRSWHRFCALRGDTYGVFDRPHYEVGNARRLLENVPTDLIAAPEEVEKLPFARSTRAGERFTTMLIEPPVYLAQLVRDVLVAGGTLQARTFARGDDLAALPEPALVDCLGLGAREVFGDASLVPVRGQLVHMFPQQLPYLLSHEGGYLFPRRDCVVLGGTYEVGVADPSPDPKACVALVEGHRRFFAGT